MECAVAPRRAVRALGLEWKLIARAEPQRAKLVQSDVDWLVEHR